MIAKNVVAVSALYKGRVRSLEPEGQRTGIFKEAVGSAQVTEEGIVGASIECFVNLTKLHRPDLEELDALIGCDGLSHESMARLKSRREYLESLI